MNGMDSKERELFERAVRGLDERGARRLRLARRSLLASARSPAPRWRAWSAGLAMASVLGLGLAWWWPQQHGSAPAATAPVAAHAAAADADEPVLAEADEDADLYAWLAEAPVASDTPGHHL
jgi:hypothetical protein